MNKVHKLALTIAFGITLALTFSCSNDSSFTDERDGRKYKVVKIGNMVWMAENLNYTINGSKCYEDKPENCEKYGRLYNWETANEVCPKGWLLPNNLEWNKLYHYVDGTTDVVSSESPYKSEIAGKYLKATSGWGSKEEYNGDDKFGFNALPGGGYSNSNFHDAGDYGFWWSASSNDTVNAYSWYMHFDGKDACWETSDKSYLFSVRCLRDYTH